MELKGFKNCKIYVYNKGIVQTSLKIAEGKIGDINDKINTEGFLELKDNLIVIPGFVDKHIHGANASDFMNPTYKDIKNILTAIPKEGTTSCLATTMTQSFEKIEESLQNISSFMELKEKGTEILGIHLEGPFISPKHAGAQPISYIQKGNPDIFDKFNQAGGNHIKQVTLACEESDLDFVRYLKSKGVVASLGHTDSSYDMALKAIEAGASSTSHTFNAMRGIHHRDIGVVGAGLLQDEVSCELICDFIHVSIPAIQLLYKNKPKDKICLITDAMEAKYMPEGSYQLGGQKVIVKENAARLENGVLAGSTLKMNEAVRNFIKATGASMTEAIDCATISPAKCIGMENRKGSIEIGKDADFTIIDKDFNVYMTVCRGEIVYSKL